MSKTTTYLRKAYMAGARYSGFATLMQPILSGVGAILMLHHVRRREPGVSLNGFLDVAPDFLDDLLEALKADGFRFVSVDEVADRLQRGKRGEPFLAVTLDDGYRDNAEKAAPVFRKHEVPYTIFVSPGLADGSADLWWEHMASVVETNDTVTFDAGQGPVTHACRTEKQKRQTFQLMMAHLMDVVSEEEQRRISRELCETCGYDRAAHNAGEVMNWEEIRALCADDPLATIGAHTMNHFALARLTREQAAEEMARSADVIAEKIGIRPKHLAYPYGGPEAAGAREAELAAEAGFTTAVTTRHGLLRAGHRDHMLALPRISLNGEYQRVSYVRTMLSGITVPAANKGRVLVTV